MMKVSSHSPWRIRIEFARDFKKERCAEAVCQKTGIGIACEKVPSVHCSDPTVEREHHKLMCESVDHRFLGKRGTYEEFFPHQPNVNRRKHQNCATEDVCRSNGSADRDQDHGRSYDSHSS